MTPARRSPRAALRPAALLASGILVLGACGGDGDASEEAAEAPEAPVAPTTSRSAVPPASAPSPTATNSDAAAPAPLDFTAPLVGGGEIEMGELAGRPVLLWFWAPW